MGPQSADRYGLGTRIFTAQRVACRTLHILQGVGVADRNTAETGCSVVSFAALDGKCQRGEEDAQQRIGVGVVDEPGVAKIQIAKIVPLLCCAIVQSSNARSIYNAANTLRLVCSSGRAVKVAIADIAISIGPNQAANKVVRRARVNDFSYRVGTGDAASIVVKANQAANKGSTAGLSHSITIADRA